MTVLSCTFWYLKKLVSPLIPIAEFAAENGVTFVIDGTPPLEKIGLNQYKELLDAANAEKLDTNARYEKYAAAQAWLTDSSLLMPTASSGGSPVVSNVVPFSKPYSQVGIKGDPYIFKGMKLQKDIVTTKEYEEALKKWQKEKLESNGKYQKELEKHIK